MYEYYKEKLHLYHFLELLGKVHKNYQAYFL